MHKDTLRIVINVVIGITLAGSAIYGCSLLEENTARREQSCKEKGGTYLRDNGICLDVKSIPLER